MKSSTLTKFARLGYTAHGLVYGIVGLLAVSAFRSGGQPEGEEGVWRAVLGQPFGKLLLVLIGLGMLAYAVFRTVQAISDTSNHGNEAGGLAQRAGAMISAFTNTFLGLAALGAAIPAAKRAAAQGGAGGSSAKSMTAEALSQPFGEWLVGFVGLFLIFAGFYQISVAWGLKFLEKMRIEQMNSTERTWATRSGVMGIAARATVFLVTGVLVMRAAFNENPAQTGSLQAALKAVESQGTWYLLLLAAGLVAYAIHEFFMARYIKVHQGQPA
jgi:hypothetical protein